MESFLKFIDCNGQHDAESIANHIIRTPAEYDINLDNVVVKVSIMRAIYQETILECKPDSKH